MIIQSVSSPPIWLSLTVQSLSCAERWQLVISSVVLKRSGGRLKLTGVIRESGLPDYFKSHGAKHGQRATEFLFIMCSPVVAGDLKSSPKSSKAKFSGVNGCQK